MTWALRDWTRSEPVQTMLAKPKNPGDKIPGPYISEVQAVSALPVLSAEQADLLSATSRLLSYKSNFSLNPAWNMTSLCFQCADGTCFQIIDDIGRPRITNKEDLDGICRALDDADAIMRALETKLSLNLEPTDILAKMDVTNAIMLSVNQTDIGVIIALSVSHPNAELWRQNDAKILPDAASTPCQIHLQCIAANLTLAEAGDLSEGDMLILSSNLAMQIDAGPATIHGVFDVHSGAFLAAAQPVKLERNSQMSDNDPSNDTQQLSVPVSIRLPDQMVSMETLAALQPGSNLPIGPLLQGLPVELIIAGKKLASGEIVQIGSTFAVLIDEREKIGYAPRQRAED